ncbi:MAG: PEP-CTERM sorting domain-containing protein [Sedimentisphaerales bacterium]|jgi:hypothetical protein
MKKFLVLALVLSMATMAQAGIVFQSSATEVHPSDILTISLVTTNAEHVQGLELDAIVDGTSTLGTAATPLTLNSHFNFADPGYLVNTGGALIKWVNASDTTVGGDYATGTLYTFLYHVPTAPASTYITINASNQTPYGDTVEIDFSDGSSIYSTQGVVIHVIPEPMTMGLLGLGGLFLRRRK